MPCAAPIDEQGATGRRERRVVSALFADLVGFTFSSYENAWLTCGTPEACARVRAS